MAYHLKILGTSPHIKAERGDPVGGKGSQSRPLYDDMLDSLKMEQLNEGMTNIDGTYVMPIINTINFIILFYH